jgi:hypothetical protein
MKNLHQQKGHKSTNEGMIKRSYRSRTF